MSLWNSCDSTQETGLVKVCRKDNFEETGVQIEVAFSLANSHVVKGLLSSFWKLTELLFGMSVCQKRYPLSLLLSESFLAARLREAACSVPSAHHFCGSKSRTTGCAVTGMTVSSVIGQV